jgi:hypothetical protein
MLSVLKGSAAGLFETARRVLLVLALCLWFGGFTFYSLVVIHVGHKVFESLVQVGFLTQAVTRWLNLIGVGALGLMLWNVFAGCSRQSRFIRGVLLSTWLLAAGIEVALFVLHPRLDAHLDPETRILISRDEFKSLHLLYINLSTTQWVATIVYVWASVCAWRKMDAKLDYARISGNPTEGNKENEAAMNVTTDSHR